MTTSPAPDQDTAGGVSAEGSEPESEPVAPRRMTLLFVTAGVGLVLDQVTKGLALSNLAGGRVVEVLGSVLEFRLVRNSGAAFSLGEGLTWIFTVLAICVVAAVIWAARQIRSRRWALTLGLLLAGALGNLADRLFRAPGPGRGEVVDFIDYAGKFVGNVADIAIVAAMVLMVVGVMTGLGLDGRRR